MSTRISLAIALVSKYLDYNKSHLSGINHSNILKPQRVQKLLTRAITNTSKYEHMTPVLKSLHWLLVQQRISFKLGLTVDKTLNSGQPQYLNQFPQTYSTRSLIIFWLYINQELFLVNELFSFAGPTLRNPAPVPVHSAQSLVSFSFQLKTCRFQLVYLLLPLCLTDCGAWGAVV